MESLVEVELGRLAESDLSTCCLVAMAPPTAAGWIRLEADLLLMAAPFWICCCLLAANWLAEWWCEWFSRLLDIWRCWCEW